MVLSVRGICKEFSHNGFVQKVLYGIDLDVEKGEFVAIMGPSGCGKSTLLHILGLMLKPSSVESLMIDGEELRSARDFRLTEVRREKIGFVFQRFNLIDTLSVEDNLRLSYKVRKLKVDCDRIRELLDAVGLEDKRNRKPNNLSIGEQQRIAFIRGVLHNPVVLLADEPTGNLDSKNAEQIMDIMKMYNREFGQTILMVTHNEELAKKADKVIYMLDGRIVG